MKTNNIIRFSTEDYKAITTHLASSGKDESFIYGLFSATKNKENTIYICNRLIIPDKKHLQSQSRVSIEPDSEYQAITYGLAYELKKSVIDIHTHPFSCNARFSSIDDHYGTENAKYITANFPDTSTMGMVVLGKGFDNFEARIWNRKHMCFEPVNRIEILGSPTAILINSRENISGNKDDIYARHKIIPGWQQGLLEDLKVFVCGLGGNGSLIFDSLLSLGIGKRNGWISACDPDILEVSNLPRIPYAYPEEIGMSKARLAKVHADAKNHKLNVFCYNKSVENKEVQDIIKQANIIFGAVDNDGARVILNELAARYSIPYIDIGTEIIPEDSSYQAMGQVHTFIPGKTGCLMCTGAIDPSEAALDSMSKEDNADYERAGYVRGTSETPTPSVLHLNGIASHLAISQFLKMIFADNFEGMDYLQYNRQKSILLAASSVQDDQCPVCGLHGYIGNGDEDKGILEDLSDLKDNSAFEEHMSNNKNLTTRMII
jgi:molybdopterin/thiamine biosynthesis adenylyltransferase